MKKIIIMARGGRVNRPIKFMQAIIALIIIGLAAFSVDSYMNMYGLLDAVIPLIGCGLSLFAVCI